MEIEEIIRNLFGYINPVGETVEDNRRYEKLYNYRKAIDYIIEELVECARYKYDKRYSMQRIGKEAYDILDKQLSYLKDVFEEINDEEIN